MSDESTCLLQHQKRRTEYKATQAKGTRYQLSWIQRIGSSKHGSLEWYHYHQCSHQRSYQIFEWVLPLGVNIVQRLTCYPVQRDLWDNNHIELFAVDLRSSRLSVLHRQWCSKLDWDYVNLATKQEAQMETLKCTLQHASRKDGVKMACYRCRTKPVWH